MALLDPQLLWPSSRRVIGVGLLLLVARLPGAVVASSGLRKVDGEGPGAPVVAAVAAEATETRGRHGTCGRVPQCSCFDPADSPAACGEHRQFDRLVAWIQEGMDQHLPEAVRSELPRLADVIEMRYAPRSKGGYRHVVSTRGLKEGEMLMRIPMEGLMHAGYYRAADAPASSLAARLRKALADEYVGPFVAHQTWLALYMLEQRRLGAASSWGPYLDVLPEDFPSVPIWFSDEDWSWLEGSLFRKRIKRHRESLEKQYETISELVPEFPSEFSLDEFLWARAAISSRVFGWNLPGLPVEDGTDFMVPLGDMFNHRSPKQVEWSFNKTTNSFEYKALEDVPAGSEILISYGGKCNSQYLLSYGFTIPNVSKRWPPVSTVRVEMALDAEVPEREPRQRWLLKSRLQEVDGELAPEEFELKANTFKAAGAENMLAYARLLSLPGGDEFERRVKSRSCSRYATPPHCQQAMGLENELAAVKRSVHAVDAALAAYPTTLEEDEELLPTLSGLPLSLVTLRRDEKVVLRWWQRFFKLALEGFSIEPDLLENRTAEAFGEFSPESAYLRVSLPALLKVEREAKVSA